MTDPLTDEELARLRGRHRPHREYAGRCTWCDGGMPCDAARAVATIDALAVYQRAWADLTERLDRAERDLLAMVTPRAAEPDRIRAKAEGVALARSYMRDAAVTRVNTG